MLSTTFPSCCRNVVSFVSMNPRRTKPSLPLTNALQSYPNSGSSTTTSSIIGSYNSSNLITKTSALAHPLLKPFDITFCTSRSLLSLANHTFHPHFLQSLFHSLQLGQSCGLAVAEHFQQFLGIFECVEEASGG